MLPCSMASTHIFSLIDRPDGWRGSAWATLPEALFHELPSPSQVPVESRDLAITAACDSLLEWTASILHGPGSGRNKKQAKLLRAWAEKAKPVAAAVLQTLAMPPAELREVAIEELHESPENPRKYFAKKKLDELAASMREHGFWSWNPIMGRPRSAGGYEIGAGHRRYRAAKAAGLATVPVAVSAMSDEQFLRVLTFDNSNREDPHALDEAAGFRFYMEKTGCKVTDIANEIGQSKEYVYQRLKYADLIDPAREAFMDEKITSGHAVLIARLQPADQKQSLEYCLSDNPFDRGVSVRDLAQWIERAIHRDVRKAAFDLKSPDLLAGVRACTDCLKRAGNSPELFPDIKHADTCMDPTCYNRKESAHIQIKLAARNTDPDPKKPPLLQVATAYRSYGEKTPAGVLDRGQYTLIAGKQGRCDHSRDAIVVEGNDRGRSVAVCIDKKCKKHKGASTGYKAQPAGDRG